MGTSVDRLASGHDAPRPVAGFRIAAGPAARTWVAPSRPIPRPMDSDVAARRLDRLLILTGDFFAAGGSVESIRNPPLGRGDIAAALAVRNQQLAAAPGPQPAPAPMGAGPTQRARHATMTAAVNSMLRGGAAGLVARDARGDMVGLASWRPTTADDAISLGWIGTRGEVRGAGAALLASALMCGRPQGGEGPRALVLSSLSEARPFYESLGFQPWDHASGLQLDQAAVVSLIPRILGVMATSSRNFGVTVD